MSLRAWGWVTALGIYAVTTGTGLVERVRRVTKKRFRGCGRPALIRSKEDSL